jgi:phosphomannomutase
MSADNPWKPCDLRGIFPSAVSESLFRRVGAAIGSEIPEGSTVLVGGDFRASTPALKSALTDGLISTGLHVIDVGLVPTPIVYFEASRLRAAAVFIVTASHNPAQYNGLKWMVGPMPPTPADLARLRVAVASGAFHEGRGTVEPLDPVPSYREWIDSRWRSQGALRPGPVVLDAGNGAWSLLGPAVFRELGFDVHCLNCPPDGSFPNRHPDCARTGNLAALRAAVLERHAALGIAWDGDGDRVAFIDERGGHVTTDEISILLTNRIVSNSFAESGPANVVCDIKLSDRVRREVLRCGGTPLLERSGHAFMRSRLLSANALLGLDACGHYFLREAGSRDDGLYTALFLAALVTQEGALSELRRVIGPIYNTPELRLPTALLEFGMIRERLLAALPGAEESVLDGCRLVLDEGVVLARESTTEPVVSLRVEGFSIAGYSKLVDQSLGSLPEADALLRHQIEDYQSTTQPSSA